MDNAYQTLLGQFLSTPSARRATRAGGVLLLDLKFLSTPSARRATPTNLAAFADREIFLSTPSARRATTGGNHSCKRTDISIHALRKEGDGRPAWTFFAGG